MKNQASPIFWLACLACASTALATQRLRHMVSTSDQDVSHTRQTQVDVISPHRSPSGSFSGNALDLLSVTSALMGLARNTTDNVTNKELVGSMQDLVDEMQAHIHASLVPEQEYLNRIYGYFADCTGTLAEQQAAAGLQNSTVDEARSAHKVCRSQQAEAYEEWASCKKQTALEAADCSGWPALKATKVLDAGAACLQTTPGETYEQFLNRIKLYWTQELSKYEAMKALCSNSAEDPCAPEKAKLDRKTAECTVAQNNFERSFCDQAKQECYRIANETYTQASTASIKLLSSKRLDLGASHRIECLLKVFQNSHNAQTALEECKAMDHSDVMARLRLAIKEAPPPMLPPLPSSLPGQSGFQEEEYNNINSTEMMACQLPFAVLVR